MDYEYDVFVSYSRQSLRTEWIVDIFLPQLLLHLGDEVVTATGRRLAPVVIDQAAVNFDFDRSELNGVVGFAVGTDWRESLRRVVSKARCMVGIWSPQYFVSEICLAEWYSFQQRDMVVPLSVNDGDSFPLQAHEQRVNMNDYFLVGPAMRQSQTYIDFQRAMKQFCVATARKIAAAPEWHNWNLIEKAPPPPTHIDLTTFANGKSPEDA